MHPHPPVLSMARDALRAPRLRKENNDICASKPKTTQIAPKERICIHFIFAFRHRDAARCHTVCRRTLNVMNNYDCDYYYYWAVHRVSLVHCAVYLSISYSITEHNGRGERHEERRKGPTFRISIRKWSLFLFLSLSLSAPARDVSQRLLRSLHARLDSRSTHSARTDRLTTQIDSMHDVVAKFQFRFFIGRFFPRERCCGAVRCICVCVCVILHTINILNKSDELFTDLFWWFFAFSGIFIFCCVASPECGATSNQQPTAMAENTNTQTEHTISISVSFKCDHFNCNRQVKWEQKEN